MRRGLLAFVLLCAASVWPAPPCLAATISDAEAVQHVGEHVSVRGVVAGVYTSRSNTTFINFGKPYPNHSFTAVIFSSASSRFKDPQRWEGKTITVTGKIKLYRGKPEMILESPSQVSE
jgi:DNA/RNA endonuclease YhcR with UshA esterase domain